MVINSKNKTPKRKKAIINKLLTNNISDDSSVYKDTKKLRKKDDDKSILLSSQSGGADETIKFEKIGDIVTSGNKVSLKIQSVTPEPAVTSPLVIEGNATIVVKISGAGLSSAPATNFSCSIISKYGASKADELPALSIVRTYTQTASGPPPPTTTTKIVGKSSLYYDDSLLKYFDLGDGGNPVLKTEINPFRVNTTSGDQTNGYTFTFKISDILPKIEKLGSVNLYNKNISDIVYKKPGVTSKSSLELSIGDKYFLDVEFDNVPVAVGGTTPTFDVSVVLNNSNAVVPPIVVSAETDTAAAKEAAAAKAKEEAAAAAKAKEEEEAAAAAKAGMSAPGTKIQTEAGAKEDEGSAKLAAHHAALINEQGHLQLKKATLEKIKDSVPSNVKPHLDSHIAATTTLTDASKKKITATGKVHDATKNLQDIGTSLDTIMNKNSDEYHAVSDKHDKATIALKEALQISKTADSDYATAKTAHDSSLVAVKKAFTDAKVSVPLALLSAVAPAATSSATIPITASLSSAAATSLSSSSAPATSSSSSVKRGNTFGDGTGSSDSYSKDSEGACGEGVVSFKCGKGKVVLEIPLKTIIENCFDERTKQCLSNCLGFEQNNVEPVVEESGDAGAGGAAPVAAAAAAAHAAAAVAGAGAGAGADAAFTSSIHSDADKALSDAASVVKPTLPVNKAPKNTTPPNISGDALVGSKLTCDPGIWDDNSTTTTFAYQWYNDNKIISGAINATYVTQPSDIGQPITCRVTAFIGNSNDMATSNAITPTDSLKNIIPPEITTADATEGGVLTCSPGTWSGSPLPNFTYEWTRGDATISGANTDTYTITSADIDTKITCIVTAKRRNEEIFALSKPFTPKKKEKEKEEEKEKDVAVKEKEYFDEYVKLLTHKAKLTLPEKQTSGDESGTSTSSSTAFREPIVYDSSSVAAKLNDIKNNDDMTYKQKNDAIGALINKYKIFLGNKNIDNLVNALQLKLRKLNENKKKLSKRSGFSRTDDVDKARLIAANKELEENIETDENHLKQKLALIEGCNEDMNTKFANKLHESAKVVLQKTETTDKHPVKSTPETLLAMKEEAEVNADQDIEKAKDAIKAADTKIEEYKKLMSHPEALAAVSDTHAPPVRAMVAPAASPEFNNILEKYKTTLESIDLIIAANTAAFEAFRQVTLSSTNFKKYEELYAEYKRQINEFNTQIGIYNAIEGVTTNLELIRETNVEYLYDGGGYPPPSKLSSMSGGAPECNNITDAMKILINVFHEIGTNNSTPASVDYTITSQTSTSSDNVKYKFLLVKTPIAQSVYSLMIFINDNDNDESVHPSMQKPVITIRINKENNTITLNVDPTTYSIGDDDPKFFAFIALKLLYHISLWDDGILKKLKIDTKYNESIIACIQKFFKQGKHAILQLSAKLPDKDTIDAQLLSVLKDVTEDKLSDFVASIIKAFTDFKLPEAHDSSAGEASKIEVKPMTRNELTNIITSSRENIVAQISAIKTGKKTKQEYFALTSEKQTAENTEIQGALESLTSRINIIGSALRRYNSNSKETGGAEAPLSEPVASDAPPLAPAIALQSLPYKERDVWRELRNENSVLYYVNPETNTTQWDAPEPVEGRWLDQYDIDKDTHTYTNMTTNEPQTEFPSPPTSASQGGSKSKSNSKSKSKSKSKNKTKNKTKKNHSHSNKRKIPKIKMN